MAGCLIPVMAGRAFGKAEGSWTIGGPEKIIFPYFFNAKQGALSMDMINHGEKSS